ncbi:MAG: hypothetical protein V3T64_03440, partial [Myxococcota bacterium]
DATQVGETAASLATDTTDTTDTTDPIASTEESISIHRDEAFAAAAVTDPLASTTAEDAPASSPEPDPTDVPMPASVSTGVMDERFAGGAAADGDRAASMPDLSPMMEERIREALEKIAWRAFSDISETIVKQVMNRVEKIAWEVIPEMAETLVREEIRIMKGEDD